MGFGFLWEVLRFGTVVSNKTREETFTLIFLFVSSIEWWMHHTRNNFRRKGRKRLGMALENRICNVPTGSEVPHTLVDVCHPSLEDGTLKQRFGPNSRKVMRNLYIIMPSSRNLSASHAT